MYRPNVKVVRYGHYDIVTAEKLVGVDEVKKENSTRKDVYVRCWEKGVMS